MATIRVGGKTYSDLEKMSKEQLIDTAQAVAKEFDRIGKIKPNQNNLSALQTALAYAHKQAKILEPFLKKLEKKK